MNLMEIISTAGVNGAVRHCLDLTRELARRGHRVHLLCPHDSWIRDQLCREPVRIDESDFHRWPVDELKRVRRLAREEDIEVFHTHTSRAHGFGQMLSFVSGTPCVATAHNQIVQPHWMFHTRVIATSEATGRFQRTHNLVRSRRIDVVQNFVDVRRFDEIPTEARGEVRDELGLDPVCPVIGTVGRLIPSKGLVFLLRGMARISSAIPAVRLLVIGSGQRRDSERLKAEADRLGVSSRILWAGQRSDVPRLLRALDLLVHPSLKETMPLAVIEAMASALPVVAASVAGLAECVIPGETGALVPPRNVRALSECVIALLRDGERRTRYGAAGRRRVTENFSIETQVPKIESILARTAGNPRRRWIPTGRRREGSSRRS